MSQNDTERPRWFRAANAVVREYPSRRLWVEGTLVHGKTVWSIRDCIDEGDIELDGPPPNGKPLEPQPVNASESKSEQDLLIESLRSENAILRETWRELGEMLEASPELNMSNYDHDDVSTLNKAMVDAVLFHRAALAASKERGA